jgi:hypothetical protein
VTQGSSKESAASTLKSGVWSLVRFAYTPYSVGQMDTRRDRRRRMCRRRNVPTTEYAFGKKCAQSEMRAQRNCCSRSWNHGYVVVR